MVQAINSFLSLFPLLPVHRGSSAQLSKKCWSETAALLLKSLRGLPYQRQSPMVACEALHKTLCLLAYHKSSLLPALRSHWPPLSFFGEHIPAGRLLHSPSPLGVLETWCLVFIRSLLQQHLVREAFCDCPILSTTILSLFILPTLLHCSLLLSIALYCYHYLTYRICISCISTCKDAASWWRDFSSFSSKFIQIPSKIHF